MDFDTAFTKLLGHEGGYVDHPNDPGGATRWGVTERVARANGYQGDMQHYPVENAKAVYRAQYWDTCKCQDMPPAIRFDLFDAAVNSGVKQSIKWLQQAVGVPADGNIGPVTLRAVNGQNPDGVVRRFNGCRLMMLADLKTWPSFGRGWAKRVASNLLGA